MFLTVASSISLFLLIALLFLFIKKQKSPLNNEDLIKLKTQNESLKQQIDSLQEETKTLRDKNDKYISEKAKLQEECETKDRELKHKKQTLEETAKVLKLQFESTAQKIFKETTQTYKDTAEKSIENIITPLKTNITDFKKSIESLEGREKYLQETINGFRDMNQDMRDGTLKLTEALQGNTAVQGQWGEFMLENILEKSGLRKGEEFIVQSKGLGLQNDEGQKLKPDVTVKLSDKKHIIIDSKVSFTHYQKYSSETNKDKKEEHKRKVISSLTNHITSLAQKNYPSSEGLKTPDFVLMFIPVESVFSFAIQEEQGLFDKAWAKSIVIVGPITLWATLRTIASIWKIEKQNKNAEQIAKESGLLYDKFTGFLKDMIDIEKGIKTASNSYHNAIKKLDTGQGNLIQKIEHIKKLGAKTNKEIPTQFRQD